MDIFHVSDLAAKHGGEYVLGSAELHTHACYLVYGLLKPGEEGRIVKPGGGHEEILCLIQGEVLCSGGAEHFRLKPGHAFHLKGEETYLMSNPGETEAVYVLAGGHSEIHSH